MQRLLLRRIPRNLRRDAVAYAALGLIIFLAVFIIVSIIAAGITVRDGTHAAAENNRIEDGQFFVFEKLTEKNLAAIDAMGVELEEQFYLDLMTDDGSTLRFFKNRERIDLVHIDFGTAAQEPGELVLEKRYCAAHGLDLGDEVLIGGSPFSICGIGSSPDYDNPLRTLSDASADSSAFGTAFVTAAQYEELLTSSALQHTQEYVYAYRFSDRPATRKEREAKDRALKDLLKDFSYSGEEAFHRIRLSTLTFFGADLTNLTQFVPQADNIRIFGAADDVEVNIKSCYIAGVILIILLTYIISVFVVHQIDREKEVIGALFALGVRQKDLMLHYIALPVLVTFLCGLIGLIAGMSPLGIESQMTDSTLYYSIPELPYILSPFLILYGVVMPPLTAAVVNAVVIRKKLSRPVLKMLRREEEVPLRGGIRLGRLSFLPMFQLRQMLRELRTEIAITFGMLVCLLVLMIGLDCYVYCENVEKNFVNDTRYEYMYTFKYPPDTAPGEGYPALARTLQRDLGEYTFDVTVLGLTADNPFFDAPLAKDNEQVCISSSFAIKYGLSAGDAFHLQDAETDKNYSFRVGEIVQYSPGFTVFMDIEKARELFGEGEEYYNVIYSDHEIPISPTRLYATSTRADIEKASSVFLSLMMPMVRTLTVISAFVLIVVIFLMMKVMLDRSAYHISVMRLFGFRSGEVRRMYLDGNLITVIAGAMICIPLSKWIMDRIFPYFVINVNCGEDLSFPAWMYAASFLLVLFSYFISELLLLRRIRKTSHIEVLKMRE
ncbi:MAG: ABC transporter permease [Lachnospiraceae bacterium]|nr:ABC transporter permease [Lachnospiraceae bacterium]